MGVLQYDTEWGYANCLAELDERVLLPAPAGS
jgi:hypothetical protein